MVTLPGYCIFFFVVKPKPVKSLEIVNLTSTAAYIKLERPNISYNVKLKCRTTWNITEGSQSKSNTSLIDIFKAVGKIYNS